MDEYNQFLEIGKIKSVGFDLDGTLYSLTDEMNDRIRNKVSEKILSRKPELTSVPKAREFFGEQYRSLHSGTRVSESVGYDDPGKIMNRCLGEADILDLMQPNPELAKGIEGLSKRYETYILSNGPKSLGLKKLDRLGINPLLFYFCIFNGSFSGVTKEDGTGFDKALDISKYPAENHLYIGDREKSDMVPAKERGMQAILVNNENSRRFSLSRLIE